MADGQEGEDDEDGGEEEGGDVHGLKISSSSSLFFFFLLFYFLFQIKLFLLIWDLLMCRVSLLPFPFTPGRVVKDVVIEAERCLVLQALLRDGEHPHLHVVLQLEDGDGGGGEGVGHQVPLAPQVSRSNQVQELDGGL